MKIIDADFSLIRKIALLLFAGVVAFVPLVVRMYPVALGSKTRNFWGNLVNFDFFSFYKMNWLLLFSALLVIVFLIYFKKSRNKFINTYYYLPLIIYALLALLSSLLSEYTTVAVHGFPNRYENIFVLLSYIFLTFAAINLIDDRDSTKFVLGALFISAFILGIHGMLQFLGYDPFQTELGRNLIVPSAYEAMAEGLSFAYSERRIYSTMFNPNYVGSYGAMLVILTLGLYITRNRLSKLFIMGSLSVLMFAFLVGSQSRAGMVGFVIGIMILAYFMRGTIYRKRRAAAIIILAFIVVFVGMDVYSMDDILGEIISPTTEPDLIEEEITLPKLQDIRTDENTLIIDTEEIDISVIKDGESFTFANQSGEELEAIPGEQDNRLQLQGDRYQEHEFVLNEEESTVSWYYDNMEADFKYEDGEFYIFGTRRNLYEINSDIPAWGFEGRERLGSSRGYIWSRSLPLTQDTLFTGHGPDSFAFYFPQEDAVGQLRFLSTVESMVDKPHNLYIQKAVNTGVVSLLALILLWGAYFLQGFKIYRKADFTDWQARVGVSIMAAVAAYLATGFFNDSVVSVAPVFWVLLGIGISMNIQYRKSRD